MSAVGRWVCRAVDVGEPGVGSAVPDTGALADSLAVGLAPGFDVGGVLPTTGAPALAVGRAVDAIGAGDWAVPDTVGAADTVGVAAPVGEVAGLVAVGWGGVAATVGDAWRLEDAVGCSEGFALGVDWFP